MGVYKDFYVILGYEVDYDIWKDLIEEAFNEKDWDREEELNEWFVADGMSGTYSYFGKTVFHAKEHGDNNHKIIPIPRNDDFLEIRNKYLEIVGEGPEGIPKLIAFEHYH